MAKEKRLELLLSDETRYFSIILEGRKTNFNKVIGTLICARDFYRDYYGRNLYLMKVKSYLKDETEELKYNPLSETKFSNYFQSFVLCDISPTISLNEFNYVMKRNLVRGVEGCKALRKIIRKEIEDRYCRNSQNTNIPIDKAADILFNSHGRSLTYTFSKT